MSDGGKGSKPRPIEVPREKFNDNWDNIFGKKVKDESSSNNTDNRRNDTKKVRGKRTKSNI
jgi:hypothetical protein